MSLGDLVARYQEFKYGIINDMADSAEDFVNDTWFIDKGNIISKANYYKSEIENLDRHIAKCNIDQDALNNLKIEKDKLQYSLAYVLSNDIDYVSESLNYLEGVNSSLRDCIYGIEEHLNGNEDDALKLMEDNYGYLQESENHFLINKIYGILLVKEGRYFEGLPLLKIALNLVPEDIECYYFLAKAYENTLKMDEKKIVDEIIDLLTTDDWDF